MEQKQTLGGRKWVWPAEKMQSARWRPHFSRRYFPPPPPPPPPPPHPPPWGPSQWLVVTFKAVNACAQAIPCQVYCLYVGSGELSCNLCHFMTWHLPLEDSEGRACGTGWVKKRPMASRGASLCTTPSILFNFLLTPPLTSPCPFVPPPSILRPPFWLTQYILEQQYIRPS